MQNLSRIRSEGIYLSRITKVRNSQNFIELVGRDTYGRNHIVFSNSKNQRMNSKEADKILKEFH